MFTLSSDEEKEYRAKRKRQKKKIKQTVIFIMMAAHDFILALLIIISFIYGVALPAFLLGIRKKGGKGSGGMKNIFLGKIKFSRGMKFPTPLTRIFQA
jgi:hypothetical protein